MHSFYHLLLQLLLLVATVVHGEDGPIQSESTDEVEELIKWMKANGGFLDPRVEIRKVDPKDPSSYYGVFTNAPIREDEVLIKIPDSLKIKSVDDGEDWYYSDMICNLSWTLAREFEKGDESKYLPYINYLRTQEKGQIPGAWSSAGKELLLQVQGDLHISDRDEEWDDDPTPKYLVNWLEDYANEECALDGKTLDQHYIALAVQRGYDSVLVPIYDMINHSNNLQTINIFSNSVEDDDEFIVQALRDIAAGEELFYSYDECPECDEDEIWGTPELLRDFGFVEDYPQKFHLSDDMAILVEAVETEDGQLGYVASCIDDKCPEKAWVEERVHKLMHVEKSIAEAESHSSVPGRELAIIKDYHKALLVAFSAIWSQCPEPVMSMSARRSA